MFLGVPTQKNQFPSKPRANLPFKCVPCPDVPARRKWCPCVDYHIPRDLIEPDSRFHDAKVCPASNPHPKSPTWEPKGRSTVKGGRAKRALFNEMGLYRDHSCADGVSSTCLPLKLREKGFMSLSAGSDLYAASLSPAHSPHTPI